MTLDKVLTKEFLEREYIQSEKSITQIAKDYHCNWLTVRKYLRIHGISIREDHEQSQISHLANVRAHPKPNVCRVCNIPIGPENWYRPDRWLRWRRICIPCARKATRIRMARWRQTHQHLKSDWKIKRREARLNEKGRAMKRLGGIRCVNCGCTDIRVLEINHIRGNEGHDMKRIQKERVAAQLRVLVLKGVYTIDDFNVLCRVCNAADYVQRKFGLKFTIIRPTVES